MTDSQSRSMDLTVPVKSGLPMNLARAEGSMSPAAAALSGHWKPGLDAG